MRKTIINKVNECIAKAEKHYGLEFETPLVRFDLRGRSAGQCLANQWLKFNMKIAEENREDFLATTVPHEVAHWIQFKVYNYGSVKPHGREWKYVMESVMGVPAVRCHAYSVESARKVKASYRYECNCRTYDLTVIRHRRAMNGSEYRCRKCRGKLKFIGLTPS